MSELHRLLIEENGKTLEIYVESPPLPSIPTSSKTGERPGAKSATDVQEKILAYANFAIGAFQHLGAAEVEEISLKFGIKLGGKTGIIFTEGSAEGSMEVSVKCKFPKTNSASHQS
jgi:Trypsin-co-occurring domain 1